MKFKHLSYFIFLLLVIGFSCKKENYKAERYLGDILLLSKNSIVLDSSGEKVFFLATTNLKEYKTLTDEDWLHITKNIDTVKVTADSNTEGIRSGSILIIAGADSAIVNVTQKSGKKKQQLTINIKGIDLVKVDSGSFMMGAQNTDPNAPNYGVSPYGESDYRSNQSPVHKVTLNEFFIGKYQITQGQWDAIMGSSSNPSHYNGPNKENYPVDGVTYDQAVNFCVKLSQVTGKTFRLPTEAEWEYAASGGQKSLGYLYSGSNNPFKAGMLSTNSADRFTHADTAVGSFVPNEIGIYDMTGNVYEWCSDYYGAYPDHPVTNPTGPATGTKRILRGASWRHYATTIYYRGSNTPDYTGYKSSYPAGFTGFRVVYVPANKGEITIDNIDFVEVKGGDFMMGSQNTDPDAPNYGVSPYGKSDWRSDQTPVHKVTLSTFYIGKYQVTQSQWENVVGSNPSKHEGADYPVEMVDYNMAVDFCHKISQQTGKNFRLPTEAEWEYAARGGQKSKGYLYAGGDDPYKVGNFAKTKAETTSGNTTKVGSFIPNELDIYDMSGNVYEWVSGYYGNYPSSPQVDPTGLTSGTKRIARGASWHHYATTVYYRGNAAPSYTGGSYHTGLTGLRLVYVP